MAVTKNSSGALTTAGFHELFVHNPLPMWLFDKASLRFIEVNEAAMRQYGWSRDEFLQMTLADIRPPEDVARLMEATRQSRETPASSGFRRSQGWRHRTKSGADIWVDIYSHDFWHGDQLVRLAMIHDVSELRQAAERLQQQSAFFSQLFHNSPEAIVMLDEGDRVLDSNRAFQELFQYQPEESKGRFINDLVVPQERNDEASALSQQVLSRRAIERDTVRRRKDGSRVDVSVLGYPVTLGERQVGVFAIYRDITQAKRIAQQLAYHTTHDALTGLISRHEFERCLREKLVRSVDAGAVARLEVDQLKLINDGYGHEAGDRLLIELAQLLQPLVSDPARLARMGGDEFGLLIEDGDAPLVLQLLERLRTAVAAFRFRWQERQHAITLSVGVLPFDGTITDLNDVMAASDAACSAAKARGRDRVEVYHMGDQDLLRMRGELSWGARVMEALEHDSFELYFQRILPLSPAGTAHSEILLRVKDNNGAPTLPGVFVSAAERYGMMPTVDRHVIVRVLRELQRRRADHGFSDVVSVNLSGSSLGDESLSRYIREQLGATGVPPAQICFEITETAAIRNIGRALNFISEVRALGCKIALDDFGSGMSSFAYLKSFDVDFLKIDGSFIRDMATDPLDSATAEAINRVAQVKGLKTVAECVENEETVRRLRELGVDYAQGFHLHKPEPW